MQFSSAWSKAVWPILLCVAAAGVTLAWVRLSGRGTRDESALRIDVPSRNSFDQVRAALEGGVPSAGFTIFEQAGVRGTSPAEVSRRLDALADKEGLMILGESDVGRRQSYLLGKTVRSKLYMIGNPLIASRMIALDPAASLYVPLRVLVYEDGEGVTHVAYDRPSGLLDTLENNAISEIARSLDGKLHDLAATAAAGVTAPTNSGTEPMTDTRFMVDHVRLVTDKPFDDVAAAFLRRLGKFDPATSKALAEGGDVEVARKQYEGMVGPSGFMLFGSNDHGELLRIVGQRRKAVQYVVGNPLFALEMTRHAIGAALYAPLRVLIYEEGGKTYLEYDRPSSQFGQCGDARVDEMATSLDRKFADLAAEAMR
jgi:uncharacterized protein (DUF302 family)